MEKYYLLLCDGKEMVYPIRSNINPYTNKTQSYCPGQPSFFGGNDDGGKGLRATLTRETYEESAKTFDRIDEIHKFTTLSYGSGSRIVDCYMYYAKDYKKIEHWPSQSDYDKMAPEFREMCYVAWIEKKAFTKSDTSKQIAQKMLDRASTLAGTRDWIQKQIASEPTAEYLESVYAQGFDKFVRDWLK